MAPPKTPGARRGTIKGASSPNVVTFTIRCLPIPKDIVQSILENAFALQILQRDLKNVNLLDTEAHDELLRQSSIKPEEFWDTLEAKGRQAGGDWEEIANKAWAFGPGKTGACILADARKPGTTQS
jgi:ribosome assembly protein 1